MTAPTLPHSVALQVQIPDPTQQQLRLGYSVIGQTPLRDLDPSTMRLGSSLLGTGRLHVVPLPVVWHDITAGVISLTTATELRTDQAGMPPDIGSLSATIRGPRLMPLGVHTGTPIRLTRTAPNPAPARTSFVTNPRFTDSPSAGWVPVRATLAATTGRNPAHPIGWVDTADEAGLACQVTATGAGESCLSLPGVPTAAGAYVTVAYDVHDTTASGAALDVLDGAGTVITTLTGPTSGPSSAWRRYVATFGPMPAGADTVTAKLGRTLGGGSVVTIDNATVEGFSTAGNPGTFFDGDSDDDENYGYSWTSNGSTATPWEPEGTLPLWAGTVEDMRETTSHGAEAVTTLEAFDVCRSLSSRTRYGAAGYSDLPGLYAGIITAAGLTGTMGVSAYAGRITDTVMETSYLSFLAMVAATGGCLLSVHHAIGQFTVGGPLDELRTSIDAINPAAGLPAVAVFSDEPTAWRSYYGRTVQAGSAQVTTRVDLTCHGVSGGQAADVGRTVTDPTAEAGYGVRGVQLDTIAHPDDADAVGRLVLALFPLDSRPTITELEIDGRRGYAGNEGPLRPGLAIDVIDRGQRHRLMVAGVRHQFTPTRWRTTLSTVRRPS